MAMMLTLMGDEVRTAHDGAEAVEAAEAFRPQVILMDVGMPRLNGLEATRRIREQTWGRSVTVVALTGWVRRGQNPVRGGRLRRPPGQAGPPSRPGAAAGRADRAGQREAQVTRCK
jgi:CheY-like chemotaxis protein